MPAGRVDRSAGVFQPEEVRLQSGKVGPFLIDATEVTNAQFAAFVASSGYVTAAERRGATAQREGGAVFDRALQD